MKPLASPVAEFRTMGLGQLLGGAAFFVVAIALDAPAYDLIALPVCGAFFGTWMYWIAYRRFTRKALEHARPAPARDRERPSRMHRRIARATAALVVFTGLVGAATGSFPLVGGILAGNGVALLFVSRMMRRWEREHGVPVLRVPRWRWRWRWREGSGFFDAEDYYTGTAT